MLSSFKPCLNACSATTSLLINPSNFVQQYSNRLYLRKLSLYSVVSRILQKRKEHPGDGCRPRHSRRPTDRKESNCTGSCDAEILARAQMFVQAKTEHIFAIIGTGETRADLARFLVIHLRRKRANTRWQDCRAAALLAHMQKAASPSKRQCGLGGCWAPQARQTASRDLPAGRRANSERLGLPPLCPDHVAGLGPPMPGPLGNM